MLESKQKWGAWVWLEARVTHNNYAKKWHYKLEGHHLSYRWISSLWSSVSLVKDGFTVLYIRENLIGGSFNLAIWRMNLIVDRQIKNRQN